MQLIETVRLTADQSSITFSSIPQTFKHLIVLASAQSTRTGSASDLLVLKPNGTGLNYHLVRWDGTSFVKATGTSGESFIGYMPTQDVQTDIFGQYRITIPDYTSTNSVTIQSEGDSIDIRAALHSLDCTATPITSLEFTTSNAQNFATDSVFSLYGLLGETG